MRNNKVIDLLILLWVCFWHIPMVWPPLEAKPLAIKGIEVSLT